MSTWSWWQLVISAIVISTLIEAVGCNYYYWTQFYQDYKKVVALDSDHRYLDNPNGINNGTSNGINSGTNNSALYNNAEKPMAKGPILLSAEQKSITIPLDEIRVRNIRIDVYHPNNPNFLIKGSISAQTTAQKYLYQEYGSFILSTHFTEPNNVLLPERPNARSIKIDFNIPQQANFYISAIIINDDIHMNFSYVRWLIGFILFALPLLIWKYRLYEQICDLNQPLHRRLNWSCLGISMMLVLSILYINNTITGENVKSQCYFPQQCTFDYGSDEGSLLQRAPKTYEELYNSNIYTQQFDAWLKGQTYLDLKVDPRVAEMDDVYDMTEFYRLNVGWLFDHVIYKQRYYNYYGVSALLLVYAPIYALTGQYPTLILTLSILAALAVFTLHLSITALYRTFGYKANLILFLFCQLAVPAAALVYLNQVNSYPYMSAIATGAGVVGFGYSAWLAHGWKRYLLSFLTGSFIVLVVLSRPHELFVLMWFFVPLAWGLYQRIKLNLQSNQSNPQGTMQSSLQNNENEPQTKQPQGLFKVLLHSLDLKAVLSLSIITVIGAIGIMYYNYVRFDSVINFGQSLMVTASENVSKDGEIYDLSNIINALYNVIWDNSSADSTFPYIHFSEVNPDVNAYHSFPNHSSGLLSFNMNWALLLLFFSKKACNQAIKKASKNSLTDKEYAISGEQDSKPLENTYKLANANAEVKDTSDAAATSHSVQAINIDENQWWQKILQSALHPALIITAAFAIGLGAFNIIWAANLLQQYTLEGAWCISLISALLIMEHIQWHNSKEGRLLYLIVCYALISTLLFGYCYTLQGDIALKVNQDINLQIINLTRPFLVVN